MSSEEYYRSLELVGGFGYDVVVFDSLAEVLGITWRSVTIFASQAAVFAPRCFHSQTKPRLHAALVRIWEEHA